jgi:hypothetical protein
VAYKQKLESYFTSSDSRAGWQGLKAVTGYTKAKETNWQGDEKEWAENLKSVYARFEKPDTVTPPPASNLTSHRFDVADVIKVFKAIKLNKAPGPDHISSKLLKECAHELAPVMTSLFNRSVEECCVPAIWKASPIVPVPKKANPQELNDFRPVALTSQVMKSMERLMLKQLTAQTSSQMDPNQFAYRPGRSVDDATALLMHRILTHVDKPGNYARVLYIDFSSAFNTMRPSILCDKLKDMNVDPSLCRWILDYLRCRTQRVRVNKTYSTSATTYIGAPQGCVLSPVLFTIYTNDHTGTEPDTIVIKYADDAAHAGFITNNDESRYRESIENLVAKCDRDDLTLNVKEDQGDDC